VTHDLTLDNPDIFTAAALGDHETVARLIEADPALATEKGGPKGWDPLTCLAFSNKLRTDKARSADFLRTAEVLLDAGADPNTGYYHDEHLPNPTFESVLYGASGVAHHSGLTQLLLDRGADPNDGETEYHSPEGFDNRPMEIIVESGRLAPIGLTTMLHRKLDWTNYKGVVWLLEHGADPDPVFAANGETPLHVVARRWDVPVAESLVQRGADLSRRRADGRTPFAVAELNGNRAVADWLRARGAANDLQPVDRLVAACGRGDRAEAEAMLAARPTLRDEIAAEHYVALHRAAEEGDVAALALLLDCGFDASRGDEEIGKTALHSAAMAGQPDAVRVLLARGASPDVRDREFHGQPLVWAAEGSRSHRDRARDYAEVGRLLLDAGSPVEWEAGDEPAEGLVEILSDWQRDRGAPVP
jgi:ankyrin repeat protein